ncbi:hypothetical protein TVAG_098520 [Trichomonas vaginalis G3]|uniref:Uncharacterized protein n=1 Tax=Trichomonas vaginalis (strain ATCC PRA-98 / G3) TaxID=412133 RepID=A2ECD3_TRIV3|nr:guanylate cyclase protein [Trichomonas vaginalis G3]EAY09717.1 hypothetical protein TVAG_098520 [Trichomonas vaginalis G3]KAI5534004.1 guanylate cyclase protein [Trichomonas vaginalis G3]|eukprot:XP_001321940.1 hypothetical protein [Trichomonas vaginalis G3]
MEAVRNYMYKSAVNFVTYNDDPAKNSTTESVSVQHGIMQYSVLVTALLKKDSITNRTNSEREIRTIIGNTRVLTADLSAALQNLIEYIKSADDKSIKITTYSLIGGCLFIFFIYVIACYVIVKDISHDKLAIYRAIASLPKYVVSHVADSFKVLKKEGSDHSKSNSTTHDDELNKQEENMLKIFSTSSESDGGATSDSITIVVCMLFLALCNLCSVIILGLFLIRCGEELNLSAPQIDYMMAAYSYDFASLLVVNMLACEFDGYPVYGYTAKSLIPIVNEWQDKGIINYKAVRYGNSSMNTEAFSILTAEELAGVAPEGCVYGQTPAVTHDVYRCWNPDLLTTYVQTEVKSMVFKYQNEGIAFYTNDTRLTHLWHVHIIHLYEMYYNDLF